MNVSREREVAFLEQIERKPVNKNILDYVR